MNVHHVKRVWSRPLFMKWGRHDCPACGAELKKTKVSRIVNSRSDEAKNYDFSCAGGDGYMVGNVKFIMTEFACGSCGRNYSVNEIYQAERKRKKLG